MASVGLLGDVMLGRGVAEALGDPPRSPWGEEPRELCASLDLVVCNLECCISGARRAHQANPRQAVLLRAPPVAVEALRAIGVRAVSLANNHALDYEAEALADTLVLLRKQESPPPRGRGPMRPGGLATSTRTACGSGSSASPITRRSMPRARTPRGSLRRI